MSYFGDEMCWRNFGVEALGMRIEGQCSDVIVLEKCHFSTQLSLRASFSHL